MRNRSGGVNKTDWTKLARNKGENGRERCELGCRDSSEEEESGKRRKEEEAVTQC